MGSPKFWQVIPINRGDNTVLKSEALNSESEPGWLGDINYIWLPGGNTAKSARSGAHGPKDHKSCSATSMAIQRIWTLCLPTDSFKTELMDGL